MKDIKTWEGYLLCDLNILFLCDLNIFVILCEEEKCEENRTIFWNKYLKKY